MMLMKICKFLFLYRENLMDFLLAHANQNLGRLICLLDENLLVKETSFVLVPCGFFEEHNSIDPILN